MGLNAVHQFFVFVNQQMSYQFAVIQVAPFETQIAVCVGQSSVLQKQVLCAIKVHVLKLTLTIVPQQLVFLNLYMRVHAL